jgi:hypothetical protein
LQIISIPRSGKILSITGIYTYREISILPADLPKNTNVISIVITRWNAIDLRNAVRDMFASGTKNTALYYKLVFLFNIHSGIDCSLKQRVYFLILASVICISFLCQMKTICTLESFFRKLT